MGNPIIAGPSLGEISSVSASQSVGIDEDNANWVLAAPFRAHVNHLMEAAQVPWPIIAHKAGVPVPTLRTLLFGRHGKVRSKISYQAASRLIALRPDDLVWLRTSQISAERAGARIRQLRGHQMSWKDIADWLFMDVATCQAIARCEQTYCSIMVEVLAQSACHANGMMTWESEVESLGGIVLVGED